jgi:small subunit ribosomal protein S8
MVNDNIGDMLIQIKNAMMASRRSCTLPFSKEKENVLKVLVKNGFVTKYEVIGELPHKELMISLVEGRDAIQVKRVSKPGRRMYVKSGDLYKVKGGRGILVLSTSQGVIDGNEAKEKSIGGELLAEIY